MRRVEIIGNKKLSTKDTKEHEGKAMQKSDKGKECYRIGCPVLVSLSSLRVPSCSSWTDNSLGYGGKTL